MLGSCIPWIPDTALCLCQGAALLLGGFTALGVFCSVSALSCQQHSFKQPLCCLPSRLLSAASCSSALTNFPVFIQFPLFSSTLQSGLASAAHAGALGPRGCSRGAAPDGSVELSRGLWAPRSCSKNKSFVVSKFSLSITPCRAQNTP